MIGEIFSKYNSERIKVLPCATSFITSYPHHSCYMSIVGNDINYRDAILDAYFPLSFNATCHRLDFSIGIDIVEFMEHLPFLEGKFVDRKTLQQARIKYVNYIKDNIQSDYYVYLLVDYYYISADDVCYQKKHRIHDLFIYGYDDEKQVFLVKDFLNGSKYQHFVVTYDEMESAASNLELERDWLRGVKSYRRKSMIHEEIFFHTSVLHEEIIKYIHGEISGYASFNDIRRRQDYEYYYGINIYEQIMKECTYRFEQGSVMDTRCFHILFEHKKYLLHLCRNLNKAYQLNNAEEILKQIQSILNVTYILRNSSMAFNVNGNEKSYKNILKYLKKLRENEKNALTLLSQNIWLTTQFQSFVDKQEIKISDASLEYDSNWQLMKEKDGLFTETENASLQTLFYGTDVQFVIDGRYYDEDIMITIDNKEVVSVTKSINQVLNEVIYRVSALSCRMHKCQFTNIKGISSLKKIIYTHADKESYQHASVCEKIGEDHETKGNWNRRYGVEGFYLVGGEQQIPAYMTEQCIKFSNSYLLVWDTDSLDERALVNPKTDKRIMVYQENEIEFEVNLILPGDILHEISLYFADYEGFHTDLTIQAYDKNLNQLLDETKLYQVDHGVYISYLTQGDIVFRIHKEQGRLALISGIFFQEGATKQK